ncbi:MAG: DUF3592 domain-containing protein [Bacteroidia bacterium]|nr:DUF3592 domain-containing protein [Bacteroidia bacterium]
METNPSPQWTPKDKLIGAAIALVLLLGVVFVVYTHIRELNHPSIWMSGDDPNCTRAEGVVQKKLESGVKSVTYKIEFSYTLPSGKRTLSDQNVDYSTYDRYEEGGAIEICYLASNPERVTIIGNEYGADALLYMVLLDLGILVVIFLLVRSGRRQMRKNRAKTQSN